MVSTNRLDGGLASSVLASLWSYVWFEIERVGVVVCSIVSSDIVSVLVVCSQEIARLGLCLFCFLCKDFFMYNLLSVIELFSVLQNVSPYNGFTINEFAMLANYYRWPSRHAQTTTIHVYAFVYQSKVATKCYSVLF